MSPPTLPAPLRQLLAQVAQIHFQTSALTGLVIVAALALVRPWAALAVLWASAVVTIVTRVARCERTTSESGLLGFNAALIGAGLLSLREPTPQVLAYLTVVSALTVPISARWLRWGRLPPLTIQFVLAMWGALWLGPRLGGEVLALGCPDGPARVACGVGQVTFIAGALPGLCVWAAITAAAPRAGLWLGLGAALGSLGGLLGAEAQAIGLAVNLGLTAQALTVVGAGPLVRLAGVVLAAAIVLLCAAIALPAFTLPFNLATWAVLLATSRSPPGEAPRA